MVIGGVEVGGEVSELGPWDCRYCEVQKTKVLLEDCSRATQVVCARKEVRMTEVRKVVQPCWNYENKNLRQGLLVGQRCLSEYWFCSWGGLE